MSAYIGKLMKGTSDKKEKKEVIFFELKDSSSEDIPKAKKRKTSSKSPFSVKTKTVSEETTFHPDPNKVLLSISHKRSFKDAPDDSAKHKKVRKRSKSPCCKVQSQTVLNMELPYGLFSCDEAMKAADLSKSKDFINGVFDSVASVINLIEEELRTNFSKKKKNKLVELHNTSELQFYNLSNNKEVAEASMQSAALEEVTLTNSSDIIISGDGTWKTRGYSSRVGVCAVIGDKTGKCIDAEVMSSFCKGCDSWKRRGHLLTKSGKFFTLKNV
ncbi:uncharacterized protein TNCV_34961 [Trichonephila clavipes]|nr:uncharacterized protein TNCV_34961 [Trichonephila clavipes]